MFNSLESRHVNQLALFLVEIDVYNRRRRALRSCVLTSGICTRWRPEVLGFCYISIRLQSAFRYMIRGGVHVDSASYETRCRPNGTKLYWPATECYNLSYN